MNRKEFLENCVRGVCSCALAGTVVPAIQAAQADASTAKPDDWRLPFVKKRYARLLEILTSRMSSDELNKVLLELGAYCSGLSDDTLTKFRGDPDGYRQVVRQSVSGDNITYDWENGVIEMSSEERSDCFCPLNSRSAGTPPVACNCSLGWQKHTWETLLQKPVTVELKESVLRGGKRCVFVIHILAA